MGLHRMPRDLPSLALILDDLGRPAPAAWGRAIGVSERTAWRWQAAGTAPRAAMLALYWLTGWGWSAIESEARYAVDLLRQYRRATDAEIASLRAEIGRLQALGDFGCANDPAALAWPASPAPAMPPAVSGAARARPPAAARPRPASRPAATAPAACR